MRRSEEHWCPAGETDGYSARTELCGPDRSWATECMLSCFSKLQRRVRSMLAFSGKLSHIVAGHWLCSVASARLRNQACRWNEATTHDCWSRIQWHRGLRSRRGRKRWLRGLWHRDNRAPHVSCYGIRECSGWILIRHRENSIIWRSKHRDEDGRRIGTADNRRIEESQLSISSRSYRFHIQ